MPKLICFKDPAGALGKDIYDFECGITPTEMLMDAFPDGIDTNSAVVMVNSVKMVLGESPALFKKLSADDVVIYINEPKGFDPISLAIAAVIAVASVAYSLIAKPDIPGNLGVSKQSPNNTLQGQTNVARSYQGYPDNYGGPVCYPDLGGEAVTEYINNKKFVRHFMNIGIGEYDVPVIKAGATPLSNFDGATSEILEPQSKSQTFTTNITAYTNQTYHLENVLQGFLDNFAAGSRIRISGLNVSPVVVGDNINLDGVYVVESVDNVDVGGTIYSRMTLSEPEAISQGWSELDSRGMEGDSLPAGSSPVIETIDKENITDVTYSFDVNEVDGQEIPAANQGDDQSQASTTSLTTPINYSGATMTFSVSQAADWDTIKAEFDAAAGDYFIKLDYVYYYEAYAGGPIIPKDVVGNGVLSGMNLNAGSYDITITEFDGVQSTEPPFYGEELTLTNRGSATLGPFVTPIESDELWLNIVFLRGLKWTCAFSVNIVQTLADGTPILGTEEEFNFSYNDSTLDQQFRTKKLIPTAGRGYYRLTIQRTDDSPNDQNKPDLAQFENLACILNDKKRNFGNVTLLKIEIPATVNATSLRENQINTEAVRKTISYNTTTQEIDYTLRASKRFADALAHEYIIVFEQDPETIDLQGLYEIQERLEAINPELAEFSYTFDDLDIGLGERMDAILNVARCFKFFDGRQYRFGRDEAQEFDASVITQRDIAGKEVRNFSGQYLSSMPSDYDSIKLEYVDPITNKKAYVYRVVNGGTILSQSGARPNTIPLSGCNNKAQAEDRADIEIRKLVYQRFVVKETCLSQCALIDKGQTVLYADQYNPATYDGEIMRVDGDIAYTSNGIEWASEGQYYVEFKDKLNNIYRSPVFEVEGNSKAFRFGDTSVIPNISFPTGSEQLGSVYIIGLDEEVESSRWIVTDKTAGSRGTIELTLTNYDERVYEMDA